MNLQKTLSEKFYEVNKAFFEKESGINFIRVEVSLRDLKDLTAISSKISKFLDEIDPLEEEYYLDVYSPGTDEEIKITDLSNFIGEHVKVELKKSVKDKKIFIGNIVSFNEVNLIVRWNAKGQFRNQSIDIDNIEKVRKYAKISKI
ncbi:MAG: hypothetical protein HRT99_02140 [Mycoplasmatales bacterium]|nr:hypothetical protein [Mycoplasmatales bacterium]